MRVLGLLCWATAMAVLLSGGRLDARTIQVPENECPRSPTPDLVPPGCTVEYVCWRTDGEVQIIDGGFGEYVLGQSLDCRNCGGCPENPPPPMRCESTLSVSFTESVTVQIDSGITVDAAVLETTLRNSIGHADQRTFNGSATCGTVSWPACRKGSPAYRVTLMVYRDRQTQVISSYQWEHRGTGACSFDYFEDAGARYSTAVGSEYCGGAICQSYESATCVDGE